MHYELGMISSRFLNNGERLEYTAERFTPQGTVTFASCGVLERPKNEKDDLAQQQQKFEEALRTVLPMGWERCGDSPLIRRDVESPPTHEYCSVWTNFVDAKESGSWFARKTTFVTDIDIALVTPLGWNIVRHERVEGDDIRIVSERRAQIIRDLILNGWNEIKVELGTMLAREVQYQVSYVKACNECGADIGPDAKFCAQCGATVMDIRVCNECGADIEAGARFCAHCGVPATINSPKTYNPNEPRQDIKNMLGMPAAEEILKDLDSESSASDLYPVDYDGKWGYIDRSGNIVISLQFDDARAFSEGVAVIVNVDPKVIDESDIASGSVLGLGGLNEYGYIDRSGNIIIEPQFNFARDFSEGFAAVRIGEKWGFIDRSGKNFVDPHFDDADSFSEGLAVVRIGKKWGYIDRSGNLTIEPQFDNARDFSEGFAAVRIGEKWGFIDRSGAIVIQTEFNGVGDFSEEVATVLIPPKFWSTAKFAYIDKTGKVVIDSKFDFADRFSEGLARVQVGSKWGYILRSGEIVIHPQFDDAEDFSEGLAAVMMNSLWGYIDRTGKIVISPMFDFIKGGFSEGIAQVYLKRERNYIDTKGTVLWNPSSVR